MAAKTNKYPVVKTAAPAVSVRAVFDNTISEAVAYTYSVSNTALVAFKLAIKNFYQNRSAAYHGQLFKKINFREHELLANTLTSLEIEFFPLH